MLFSRREFLSASAGLLFLPRKKSPYIQTIVGPIAPAEMGKTLIHEHFLVDFIGADKISSTRWNRERVVEKVLPHLTNAAKDGVKTIFDCTPAFLGRDVELLKLLTSKSGVQLVTNTGYYGAVNNQYLPSWAFTESAEQLAKRWINEFKQGIDQSGVKPGFIKIGVDATQPLSELHRKLVRAAALTHLKTGLTICSHTGASAAAFEQLDILRSEGVDPSAFVWVHAQNEQDALKLVTGAQRGCWISLDGLGWGDFDAYADKIGLLKDEGLLHRVLISHDAGWYKPGEEDGGEFTGYRNIFKELLPRLYDRKFTQTQVDDVLIRNPAEAMTIRVRKETSP